MRCLWASSSRQTTNAIGTGAAAGAGLDVDGALDRIPRALDPDDAVVEVDVGPLEAAELAASEPAEQRDGPERLLGVGERREQLVRHLGRFDPVAAAADRGQVEVLGRIESDLVAADRPAEMTRRGSRMLAMVEGGEALAPQPVHAVLNVAALQLGQLPSAEGGDDVGVEELLVAASGRRLVRLAGAVEDRPVVGACDRHPGRPRRSSWRWVGASFRGAAPPARPGAKAWRR